MKPLEIEPLLLDARPIFQKGGSPCAAIDNAVARLKPGQAFVLLVPFEPQPLYAKLGREGFSHRSRQVEDGSWRVEFRKDAASTDANSSCGCASDQPGHPEAAGCSEKKGDIHLDTRALEPPEPLVKTLESLGALARGNKLFMRSSRRPMHLFVQLEQRGFAFDCCEQPDHSFVTEIWHADQHSSRSSCAGH